MMLTSRQDLEFHNLDKKKLSEKFRFGLESEYLVVDKKDFRPLWHQDLSFDHLNRIFESISLQGIPSCEGLDLEPPQKTLMPFVVEGYHLPDMDFQAKEILPKGVEIRTPVCRSLSEALQVHGILFQRLREALNQNGLEIVCLSHHPIYSSFSGPQNKRRHDYWQWSMEVMTTYGPDINIGLPPEFLETISLEELNAKINYYGPALSALSVASPFCDGKPWQYAKGKFGKSYRMHKRSYIAPPIEIHLDENNRFEFKVFDMPNSQIEVEAQFLSFLVLLFDRELQGRANHQSRIYELGEVSKKGLQAEGVQEKLLEFFANADQILKDWGYNPGALQVFRDRLATGRTPADDMLELYAKTQSLTDVLKSRSEYKI